MVLPDFKSLFVENSSIHHFVDVGHTRFFLEFFDLILSFPSETVEQVVAEGKVLFYASDLRSEKLIFSIAPHSSVPLTGSFLFHRFHVDDLFVFEEVPVVVDSLFQLAVERGGADPKVKSDLFFFLAANAVYVPRQDYDWLWEVLLVRLSGALDDFVSFVDGSSEDEVVVSLMNEFVRPR